MHRVLTVLTSTISFVALVGCERWALDRQMDVLCQKDGGVKIYETVTLPANEFSNVGQPLARYQQLARSDADLLGPDYRYVEEREIVAGAHAKAENGEGQLTRWHHAIYRRIDNHLLGEYVRYNRSGGDGFTFGFQPSGKNCPEPINDLAQSVFIKGN